MTPAQFVYLNDLGLESPIALIEKLHILTQYQEIGFENLPVPIIDVSTRYNTRITGQLVMMTGQSIIVCPDPRNNPLSITVFSKSDIASVSVSEIDQYLMYLSDVPHNSPKFENLAFQQETSKLLKQVHQKSGIEFTIKKIPDHVTLQTVRCVDVYLQAMTIAIVQLKKEYTVSGLEAIQQGQLFLNQNEKNFNAEVNQHQLLLFLPNHLLHAGFAVHSIKSAIEKAL